MRVAAIAFLFFAGISLISLALRVEETPQDESVKRVIQTLDDLAEQYHAYSWKYGYETRLLSDPGDSTSVIEDPEKEGRLLEGQVLFDADSGRYRVQQRSISQWIDGAASHISVIEQSSYDGRHYYHWSHQQEGKVLPTVEANQLTADKDGLGSLTGKVEATSDANSWSRFRYFGSGLAYLPPYVSLDGGEEQHIRLHELLCQRTNDGEEVTVRERDDGQWEIDIVDRSVGGGCNEGGVKCYITFTVDPNRGGVITAGQCWAMLPDGRRVNWRRLEIKLEQVAVGVHLPIQIDLISERGLDKFLDYHVELDDIKLNPGLAGDDFRLRFPKGCVVEDRVNKKTYTSPGGRLDELLSRDLKAIVDPQDIEYSQ